MPSTADAAPAGPNPVPDPGRRSPWSGPTDPPTGVGLLCVRIVGGLSLALAHGLGKIPPSEGFVGRVGGMGFPMPEAWAWLAAMAEFGGGLLLVVGLLTRPTALLVAVQMMIVTFVAHAGDPFGSRERAVLFAAIALLLVFSGAGRYSMDAWLRRRSAGR